MVGEGGRRHVERPAHDPPAERRVERHGVGDHRDLVPARQDDVRDGWGTAQGAREIPMAGGHVRVQEGRVRRVALHDPAARVEQDARRKAEVPHHVLELIGRRSRSAKASSRHRGLALDDIGVVGGREPCRQVQPGLEAVLDGHASVALRPGEHETEDADDAQDGHHGERQPQPRHVDAAPDCHGNDGRPWWAPATLAGEHGAHGSQLRRPLPVRLSNDGPATPTSHSWSSRGRRATVGAGRYALRDGAIDVRAPRLRVHAERRRRGRRRLVQRRAGRAGDLRDRGHGHAGGDGRADRRIRRASSSPGTSRATCPCSSTGWPTWIPR